MDFTRDYAWSGINYTCPPGLPTIGTSGNVKRPLPTPGMNTFASVQNRDFHDRWFRRPFFENIIVYNMDPYKQFDHKLGTFAPPNPSKKIKTPKVCRPGYYNRARA